MRGETKGEDRFRLLVEALQEGIWEIDADSITTYVNPRMAEILGYSVDEMLGRHLFDFMDETGVTLATENLERRRKGISEHHYFIFQHKDGFSVHTRLETTALHDDQGRYTGALAAVTDMTREHEQQEKIRQSEQLLRESRSRYETLLESITDSVFVLDREWRHTIVNPAGESYTGLPREKLLKQSLLELFPGIDETEIFKVFKKVMDHRQADTVESPFTFPDGRQGWYEISVYPVPEGILCISRDITRRKSSEERLKTIIENMPVLLDAFDENNRIIAWNKECERVTGYSAEEVIGHPDPMSLLYPDEAYRQSLFEELEKAGFEFQNREWRLQAKDGTERYVTWNNISPRFPIEGWAHWATGIDTTARRQAEEALSRAYGEKQLLLKELQHRAKNSFSTISGLIGLKQGTMKTEEGKQALQELELRVVALAELYDLLNQTDTPDRVDLKKYCSQVIDSFADLTSRIKIHKDIDFVQVNTKDAATIGLIITELLTNVVKHAYPGQETGPVHVSMKRNGSEMRLTVADNGRGLPESLQIDDLDSMGLRLVQGMVRQLDGTLSISSSSNGVTFEASLNTEPLR